MSFLRKHLIEVLLLLSGCIYVSMAWSPSSYGEVLKHVLNAPYAGPVLGKSRSIRSDEWAVVTPLTQATVNNDFQRYNRTSLYQEDLRINYGMPLRDWAMAFKPTLLGFHALPPAYAYSLHWFLMFAMFVGGHAWLAGWLGAPRSLALIWSVGLYFTGAVQFWWNEKGPVFAFWPCLMAVMFLASSKLPIRAGLFCWLATAWLVTNLYPPYQISLAFVSLVLIAAREPAFLRPSRLWPFALAALLAAGVAATYLWDYLQITSATIYPGSRVSGPQEGMGLLTLSWLFPAAFFDHKYNPVALNISEIGTVGLYFTVALAVFMRGEDWIQCSRDRMLQIMSAGLIAMMAWLFLPVPAWLGKVFLWDHVPGNRMHYSAGVLLALMSIRVASIITLEWRNLRLLILATTLLAAWWLGIGWPSGTHAPVQNLLPVLLLPGLWVMRCLPNQHNNLNLHLAIWSLIAGVILFGRFNPIQSAHPIFSIPQTESLAAMQRSAESTGGVLIQGLPGATGNGMGFKSASHVLAQPKTEFWRQVYPEMPLSELNQLFNRYAHILVTDEKIPRLVSPDAVSVPSEAFRSFVHKQQ